MSRHEREIEFIKREERKLNILVACNGTLMTMGKLKRLILRKLGLWVEFEQVKVKDNGDVILKVDRMRAKAEIIRGRGKFKFLGVCFFDDLTERERLLKRWLIQRERALKQGGIKAWAVYMGMYINSVKWVWDEERGELCETSIKQRE